MDVSVLFNEFLLSTEPVVRVYVVAAIPGFLLERHKESPCTKVAFIFIIKHF